MDSRNNFNLIGQALVSSQRVEFITLGIVSHLKSIENYNDFKFLTPKVFLNDDEDSKKLRKQTLGQVFRILKKHASSLTLDESLDNYLFKRNLLVHELWRVYFKPKITENKSIELQKFCKDFISVSAKVEKFYKGLLYALSINIASKEYVDVGQSIKKLKPHYNYFVACLSEGKFI